MQRASEQLALLAPAAAETPSVRVRLATRRCDPRPAPPGPPHPCPAVGCRIYVPVDRLACRTHWYALPSHLRLEIVRTHRRDTARHLDAVLAAIRLLKHLPEGTHP